MNWGLNIGGSLGPRSALKKASTPSRTLLTCTSDAGRWDALAVTYCVCRPGRNAAASPPLCLSAIEIGFLRFVGFSPPADASPDVLPLLGGDLETGHGQRRDQEKAARASYEGPRGTHSVCSTRWGPLCGAGVGGLSLALEHS